MSNKAVHIEEGEWQGHLCGCCSGGYFWKGFCCPCIMLNQTHALLENEVPDDKEPPKCGPVCLITACTGAGGVIFGCLHREKIRVKYTIDGGKKKPVRDFCINGCLPCCAIIQQYKEVDLRRKARINKKGYQQNQDMPRH